jgi:hypothetical protein
MNNDSSSNEAAIINLHKAVEQLQQDVRRVEIWAAAVSCFAQPIPEYAPVAEYLLPSSLNRSS